MVRMIARLLSLTLLLVAARVQALPVDRSLRQMSHTRWTTDDNAPSDIQALAQTRDGFLWIGSATGLYRFDGQTFERIAMPGPESRVTALLATRDGRLFIGLQDGHLLLRQNGTQADITPSSRSKWVRGIVEDQAGGIWVNTIASDLGLTRYFLGRWTRYGPSRGVPEDAFIKTTIAARDGAVWVLTQNLLLVLKPGKDRFDIVLPALNDKIESIVEDPNGHVWAADHKRGLQQISVGAGLSGQLVGFNGGVNQFGHLLVDRDGATWGSIAYDGIFRFVPKNRGSDATERLERYGSTQGLSSDGVNAILEDREGSMWIATAGGLDRFRPANVVLAESIPTKSNFGYGLFADHSGTIYITDSDTLYRVAPHGSPVAILKHLNDPMSLCEGSPGKIWVAVSGAVIVFDRGGALRLSPPSDADIMRCQSDASHAPWFLTTLGELYRRGANGWERQLADRRHPLATRFTFDPQGQPLVFYENIGLARQDANGMSTPWPVSRIPGGRIGPPYSGQYGILVGGVSGLARIRGDRVDLLGAQFPWLQHVTGVSETRRGETWIQTSLGIFHLPTATLQRAFDRPGTALQPTQFDARDGLRGANLIDYADSSSAVGADGRVWFTTTAGVVWIDPAHLFRNAVPPPVAITQVVADGVASTSPSNLVLPKGTKSLEIAYTALSLAVPERVQFRYRLEGVDGHWIDPGTRRRAFYQNLAPGSYAFTVIAANNDGVWNNKGATIRFTLPPTFLQSRWFKALCAAGVFLVLWALYQARLARITGRLKARLEARLAERERIARELHDTLLQGVQGLILRFQGIADRLPPDQVPGRLMEKALDRAEELLLEGRERVHGLRSVQPPDNLLALLTQQIDNADLPPGLLASVRDLGEGRIVDAVVKEELAGITREALSNVVRHARASAIAITVSHGLRGLKLSITDDGRGIAISWRLQNDSRHFGIAGMHERAQRIGASFTVGPSVGQRGTRLVVSVPAGVAYPSSRLHRLRSLLGFSTMEPSA